MGAVGLDTVQFGYFRGIELPIAADDDFAIAGLASIEVARVPLALTMGKFERGLLVTVGVIVPVEMRFERADAVKYPRRHGSRGPHLAAYGENRNVEAEHGTQ